MQISMVLRPAGKHLLEDVLLKLFVLQYRPYVLQVPDTLLDMLVLPILNADRLTIDAPLDLLILPNVNAGRHEESLKS
jgi:hypothetical protein